MGCLRLLLSPFGVVFGAIAMMLVTLVGFAIGLAAMGTPACYRGDTWMVSETFGAILLGIAFVASIVGGAVARRTGGGFAVLLMMGFAVFIGVVPNADSPTDAGKSRRYEGRPESRPSDAGLVDLARWSEQPDWVRYGAAIVGLTGVVFGGSLGGAGGKVRAKRSGSSEPHGSK